LQDWLGVYVTLGAREESGFVPFTEPVLSVARFLVEFTLSGVRFFASLRMTWREGLRMTASEGFRVRMTIRSHLI
jgi:hypothetical protein